MSYKRNNQLCPHVPLDIVINLSYNFMVHLLYLFTVLHKNKINDIIIRSDDIMIIYQNNYSRFFIKIDGRLICIAIYSDTINYISYTQCALYIPSEIDITDKLFEKIYYICQQVNIFEFECQKIVEGHTMDNYIRCYQYSIIEINNYQQRNKTYKLRKHSAPSNIVRLCDDDVVKF